MKNTTTKNSPQKIKYCFYILFISTIFNSCKDPCKDTNCLNGGICNDGDCNCPAGYSGKNCETYNPCYNVTCYNGGTCVNGYCDCPTGYTGSNCQTALTLVSITITKVVINNYPHSNNGFYWDSGTTSVKYPDLFLSESLGTVPLDFQWTPYKTNVTASSVTFSSFNAATTFIYPNSTYNISLYDWDGSPNDFMAGISFKPSNYKAGYPSTINLHSSILDMTLYVTWNF